MKFARRATCQVPDRHFYLRPNPEGNEGGEGGKKNLGIENGGCGVVLLTAAIACVPASPERKGPGGRLYLVRVGTGDPENITLRAVDVIRNSQVVFCADYVRRQFPEILRGKEFHDTATWSSRPS
jgi:hypothetical protein